MPRQNISPADFPQAVLRQIEELARNITIARKRRGESQAQWARKLGVSQPTMARIERGDPSVAMASYVMCIWLIKPAAGLADLIAPVNDHAALEQEVAKVRLKPRRASLRHGAVQQPRLAQEKSGQSAERAVRLVQATGASASHALSQPAACGLKPALANESVASCALYAASADGNIPAQAVRLAARRTPAAKGIAALIAGTGSQKNE